MNGFLAQPWTCWPYRTDQKWRIQKPASKTHIPNLGIHRTALTKLHPAYTEHQMCSMSSPVPELEDGQLSSVAVGRDAVYRNMLCLKAEFW